MEQIKVSFLKRIKRAIFNLEEYSNFILEKTSTSIKYILKLFVIFTIIIAIAYTCNFYMNGIQDEDTELLLQYGFEEDYIQEIKNIYNETDSLYFYIMFFIVVTIILYIVFVFTITIDLLLFTVLTLIIGKICRIKLNFGQAFNVVAYAITLPTVLMVIYIILNLCFGITIKYFSVAYDAIIYVYIITTLLMLKTDLIKQKIEVTKIVKEQEKIKKEQEQEEQENKEKQEEKENKKKKNEKQEEGPKVEGEPEANKA